MSQKVTTGVRPTLRIADKNQIPATEPERQYYFMDIAKEYLRQLSEEKGNPLTFHVSTFGCQMNARDSEKLVGILEKIGFVEEDSEEADFVIYNTCTVRENANNKVYGRLGYLNGFQKKNPFMMIGLCGCMMQEPTVVEKIKQSYRFVNLIFGTHNIYKFAELIVTALENSFPEHSSGHGTSMTIDIWKDTDKIVEDLPVERKYSFKSGVNIMFGCNNFCSYCIVPYVRGRERSREPKEIIREIEQLVADGVVEVMLLGQNVNSYRWKEGTAEAVDFPALVERVAGISPLLRVRFATSHPKDLSDRLIEVMASYPNICRAVHLPAQSGSDRMLAAMNRKYTRAWYLERVAAIRRRMPDCAVTTDLIAGFCGETAEDHAQTLSLMREVGYDSAYMFKYSQRPGTLASRTMTDDVSEEVKTARLNEIIALQNELSTASNERDMGNVFEVLVEGLSRRSSEQLCGRTSQNKMVVFDRTGETAPGDYVRVRITGCTSATLFGVAE